MHSAIREIMKIVKTTKPMKHEAMCHGGPHSWHSPDYASMEAQIKAVFKRIRKDKKRNQRRTQETSS